MAASLTLADLGEDALVAHLISLLPPMSPQVEAGPGDDCALVSVPPSDDFRQLLKVDSVVEGVHFYPHEDMRRVGWKALCRTISDIGAMGGTPLHALVTLALNPSTQLAQVTDLYRGLAAAALKYGVSIVGGETAHTPGPLVCSVFLTGSVPAGGGVKRGGGRPGDALLVTGCLGGAFRSGWHLDFSPRVREGRWLAGHRFPSAMMDLSDGLASDAPRMARASGCGVEVFPEKLPRREGASVAEAFSEGEDFELLLAVAPGRLGELHAAWKREFPDLPLTEIGRLTEACEGFAPAHFFKQGGYDHFQ